MTTVRGAARAVRAACVEPTGTVGATAVWVDRVAFLAVGGVAVSYGWGDIAQVTSLDVVLLAGVRGLLPLAIGLALVAACVGGRWPAFPARLALPVATWLGVLVVSAALAPADQLAALASLERPASGALLAWAISDLARDRWRWDLLARAVAFGGLAIALIGLGEASGLPTVRDWLAALHDGSIPIGDVPRIASTLSHPNEAAILLELSLPLLLAWAWTSSGRWRILLTLGALGSLIALVLTFSRAGIVAGLAELAILAAVCVWRGDRRPLLQLGLAALVVPAVVLWEGVANPGFGHRLSAELSPPTSAAQSSQPPTRIEFWTAAWSMAHDYPLLGVGPDNFRWRFARYAGIPEDNLGIHAHDQYLEALADTGVLGLLSLAWLLTRLVHVGFLGLREAAASPTQWPWRAAVLASLCAWLLHAVLDDFERFWPASVAFWLLAGLCVTQTRAETLSATPPAGFLARRPCTRTPLRRCARLRRGARAVR